MLHDIHRLTRYENLMLSDHSIDRKLASVLSGSSRAVRLSRGHEDARERVICEVSCGVLAPLTLLYAAWVLRRAQKVGCRRLYFLARDGRLVMDAAEILAKRWGMDIELRYLYTSREAWLLPSLREMNDFAYSWITWGYLNSISIEEVERRLKFTRGTLLAHLSENPLFSGHKIDDQLDSEQLEHLKHVLRRDDILGELRSRSDVLLQRVKGYLQAEGIFDDIPFALVDTGWKGTSQYGFSLILDKLGLRPAAGIHGFYLGLNRDSHLFPGDSTSAFLFDWNRTSIDYRIYNFLCFELLLSTNDGRTVGYADAEYDFKPVRVQNACSGNSWAVEIHHDCVRKYVEYASRVILPEDIGDASSVICRNTLTAFISRPTQSEAALYGDLFIAGEMGERDLQRLAPEMTYSDLLLMLFRRKKIMGFWPQGSMSRSALSAAAIAYRLFLDTNLLDWYRRVVLKY